MASFPSSYIPTTSTSATRAADVLTFSSISGAYPWSLYAEFERAVDTGTSEKVLSIGASATESVDIGVGSNDLARVVVKSGGSDQADVTVAGALAVGTRYKVAARASTNSAQIARGGTLGTEDTTVTTPTAPTTLTVGAFVSANNQQCFGFIRTAALFNSALADARLQALTA